MPRNFNTIFEGVQTLLEEELNLQTKLGLMNDFYVWVEDLSSSVMAYLAYEGFETNFAFEDGKAGTMHKFVLYLRKVKITQQEIDPVIMKLIEAVEAERHYIFEVGLKTYYLYIEALRSEMLLGEYLLSIPIEVFVCG